MYIENDETVAKIYRYKLVYDIEKWKDVCKQSFGILSWKDISTKLFEAISQASIKTSHQKRIAMLMFWLTRTNSSR